MCEDDWIYKLETLKDLKERHGFLGDVENRLRKAHMQLKAEEKNRADYQSEINALDRERNELVEKLRTVNKEFEEMKTVEKASNEYVQKLAKSKEQLVEEYLPLKEDVDRLRASLDVERAPELSEEGIDMPTLPTFFSVRMENQPHFPNLMMPQPGHGDYGAFHPCIPYGQMHANRAPPNSLLSNVMTNNNSISIGDSGMTIKQRPAPMKKCPNCCNDIHRNAPICPVCKSKSHSKNPKKSKKKQNEKST